MKERTCGLLLTLLVALALAACSGSGVSSTSPGTLVVQISDHREAIGDFERLEMSIGQIGVHPADAPRSEGWLEFDPDPAVVDLTQVTDGSAVTVLQTSVPSGAYDAVRLVASGAEGTLKTGDTATLPGFEEAARFEFTLQGRDTISLVLDVIVESLEDHPGGGYEMHLRSVTDR